MRASTPGRTRLGVPLALVLLAGALALAWWLRGAPALPAVETPNTVRASTDPASRQWEEARTVADEPIAVVDPTRTPLEQVVPPNAARTELVNVHVLVLGLQPEERATVEVWLIGAGEQTLALELREADEHGRLELALPQGRLRLAAWTEEQIAPETRVDVQDQPLEIAMLLEPAARITGRVTNASNGAPIAGARIGMETEGELRAVLSDSHGLYSFAMRPDGAVRQMNCNAAGFALERSSVGVYEDGRWLIDPPGPRQAAFDGVRRHGPARVDFALLPERTITGELRGSNSPLAGASVIANGHVFTGMGLASPDEASTTSASNGAFALSGLRPDVGHVLTIEHTDYAKTLLLVPPSAEPNQRLGELRLEVASSLEVHVVDREGIAVEGMQLVLDAPLPLPPGTSRASKLEFPRDPGFEQERARRERSDVDGSASFRALSSGSYSLSVRGHAPELVPDLIEIRAGESAHFELRLPTTASISGRVLGASGPVAGARVEINRMGGRYTLSDARGDFSFAGLVDGTTYHVQATWQDERDEKRYSEGVEAKPGAVIELRARGTR